MPSKRTHIHGALGAVGGIATGIASVRDEPDHRKLVVALSAAIGGHAGGLTPDLLEPAEHPHHRDFFHSAAFSGGVLIGTARRMRTAREALFATGADRRALRAQLPQDDPNRLWLGIQEILCYAAYGLMVGFVAGYISHAVADAFTSRSIPVVTRTLV